MKVKHFSHNFYVSNLCAIFYLYDFASFHFRLNNCKTKCKQFGINFEQEMLDG